jgi:hypothetical protein
LLLLLLSAESLLVVLQTKLPQQAAATVMERFLSTMTVYRMSFVPSLSSSTTCCCGCALAVTTLPVFSVNSFVVVDIKDAIFMMAVDTVAGMAIEYDNIHRVTCARK